MKNTDPSVESPSLKLGRPKLAVGGVAFVLLTVGIFWYQFHQIQPGAITPKWDQLQWGYLLPILLCLPIETLAAGLRIWVVCLVLHPGISLWTCIKAEWANMGISMLTPSQTGGGLAQMYILTRAGISLGTAMTVSLLSFAGTLVVLLFLGLYSLLVSNIGDEGAILIAAVWTFTSISAAMVLGAIRPDIFRTIFAAISRSWWRIRGKRHSLHDWWPPGEARNGPPLDRMDRLTGGLVSTIYIYRNDMARFLRVGRVSFIWVCLLSLLFLLSRCFLPFLCIRFLGLEGSTLRHILEVQMALILLVFFAPTPGGAGLAEGASQSILASIVPTGFVPYYNLLWRSCTVYISAAAGLICLLHVFVQHAPRVLKRPRKIESSISDETSECKSSFYNKAEPKVVDLGKIP